MTGEPPAMLDTFTYSINYIFTPLNYGLWGIHFPALGTQMGLTVRRVGITQLSSYEENTHDFGLSHTL